MSRSGPPVQPGGATRSRAGAETKSGPDAERQAKHRESQESHAATEASGDAIPVSGWGSKALVDGTLTDEAFADADMTEVDAEELQDFLAADGLEVTADPVFKERLREKLWRVVSEHYGQPEAKPRTPEARRAGGRKDDDT